jgi:carbamoylphosphate synthase large subunit
MERYENILVGTNGEWPDWDDAIKRIKEDNIISTDFSDLENCKKEIINKNIKYIIPLSVKDNKLIKDIKLDSDVTIVFPTKTAQILLNNKIYFTIFMLEKFDKYIPDVYYLNNKKIKDVEYPAILKPPYSINGDGVVIIYNEAQFLKLPHRNIIQKFIEDEYEYAAYMLCLNGVILNYKIIRHKFKKFNIKTDNFPKDYENVEGFDIEVFKKIIDELKYSGGTCINFKFNSSTNELQIFEINPRFGGSAFTRDFIYELLCIKKS